MTDEQKSHIIETINETTYYIDAVMNKNMDIENLYISNEILNDYPEYNEKNDMKIGFIAGVRHITSMMKKLINTETIDFNECNDFIKQSLSFDNMVQTDNFKI